jgi:hypothetical protein
MLHLKSSKDAEMIGELVLNKIFKDKNITIKRTDLGSGECDLIAYENNIAFQNIEVSTSIESFVAELYSHKKRIFDSKFKKIMGDPFGTI